MKPMKKLAKTLKERIDNIVTDCTHGITNGVAEEINSKNHDDQASSRRLSKHRELQESELFMLRWTRSLPTVIPDGPK
jgi:transposase